MSRPERLVVVAGTGTEVGKTWVASRVLEHARARGLSVAARKPAQSFAADSEERTDAEYLSAATGETPHSVCPAHRWYRVAMAPPMAADVLGAGRITLRALLDEVQWQSSTAIGLIETAGGLRSPLAHDADNVGLIDAVAPDEVLLVADAGLGTINAVRLCLDALQRHRVRVYLNRFDAGNDLHVRNRAWLADHCGCDTVTEPAQWLVTLCRETVLDRPSRG